LFILHLKLLKHFEIITYSSILLFVADIKMDPSKLFYMG